MRLMKILVVEDDPETADYVAGGLTEEGHLVFRRSYRLEASRTTHGNGLGLSLVAAIAELHGSVVE